MKFSLDQWVETDITTHDLKCNDCGTKESEHQREYNLDCQCGGSFKDYRTTVTKQGQIIDYLIDDDDEEYCIQFNDKEIQWVAGVALRPIDANWATGESSTEPAPAPHPAEEFLSEG